MSNSDHQSVSRIDRFRRQITLTAVSVLLTLFTVSRPVLAQSGSSSSGSGTGFCDIKYVGDLMNTAFSIFVGGAIALGLLTWIATSFTEALPLPQDTKKQIKRQRNSGLVASFRAVLVPALVLALLSATDIGVPDCITILP